MSAATPPRPAPRAAADAGHDFGPCSRCVFYRDEETEKNHATGRCHGAPPQPGTGWPVIMGSSWGCAVFKARK